MDNKKKLDLFENKFRDKNPAVIIAAIKTLRDESHFPGALRLLAELFDRSDNQLVINTISAFFNDLKEPHTRGEVVSELLKPYKQETIQMLASSCWQSGLDFSDYVPQFASLFVRSTYPVALECFTVLEESAMNTSDQMRQEVLDILREEIKLAEGEIVPLISECIRIYS